MARFMSPNSADVGSSILAATAVLAFFSTESKTSEGRLDPSVVVAIAVFALSADRRGEESVLSSRAPLAGCAEDGFVASVATNDGFAVAVVGFGLNAAGFTLIGVLAEVLWTQPI